MNVCSLCSFEACSHTFLIPIYFFSIKNSQSSLVLQSFITKLKHPNTERMWIVVCSWLIVFHSIIESEHTFILKTTMLMSLFSFMGLFSLWDGMWKTYKSADVYYQSLAFDTTNQALSIHINSSSSQTRVDVDQETIESKNTEILKFHQTWIKDLPPDCSIVILNQKLPHFPEKSHKNHIIVELVHGSWDDEPVFHIVFMKCAYRNSLCPVKPQSWSVSVFKTTPK